MDRMIADRFNHSGRRLVYVCLGRSMNSLTDFSHRTACVVHWLYGHDGGPDVAHADLAGGGAEAAGRGAPEADRVVAPEGEGAGDRRLGRGRPLAWGVRERTAEFG